MRSPRTFEFIGEEEAEFVAGGVHSVGDARKHPEFSVDLMDNGVHHMNISKQHALGDPGSRKIIFTVKLNHPNPPGLGNHVGRPLMFEYEGIGKMKRATEHLKRLAGLTVGSKLATGDNGAALSITEIFKKQKRLSIFFK